MGKNKNMLKAIQNLRKKRTLCYFISSNKDSPFVKNVDVCLLCTYKENIIDLGDSLFHTSVSYILDILISIIIKNNYDTAINLYQLNDQLYEY